MTINQTGDRSELLRCVVADDEPRLRQVLVRVMEGEGFICDEAGTGVEALAHLQRAPAALVLTDLRMPEMDGMELLTAVRERYPDVGVILITAVADVEVALRALTAGAMDYLTKPFHLDEVRARVSQALEKRRLIIENRSYQAGLEERVSAQARRIEELFLGGIQALVHALEVKHPYTRGHSIRVSRYSSAMARQIGLDREAVRQVEIGGHVHDIGKIGVREEILNKEGSLTDAEYAHIMTHPVVGWQILSPLLNDSPCALNIVRSHHERFDGKGVPDGLSGDAIPIEARLCAVVDAFDAMTSGRAYRHYRMSRDDAVAELLRHRETQFDSEMVAEFLKLVESGRVTVQQPGVRPTPTAIPAEELLRAD
ncbi:MAG TPA: HD domain-containing phosphohydrolase [Gemmatimonadaceae bacterium]|nr:HD domain-containing phosphohydrolase [Gemmatimonadaceae bacterium]